MKPCDICRRLKERGEVIIFEDENVLATLSKRQVTLGKSTVYYKKHVTRFTSLSKGERDALMSCVIKVGQMLERAFKPDHMNYSLLGNYEPHLHWHLIPRYRNKNKDNYFFEDEGLEYPHLGRKIYGKFDVSKKGLKELAKKIKSV